MTPSRITLLCLVLPLFGITEAVDNSSPSPPHMTVDGAATFSADYYYIPVGRTVNLICRVTSSVYNSSSLVIALNDRQRHDVIKCDDVTAQLTVTKMAPGTFFGQCCVNSCPSMTERNPFHPRIAAVTLRYGDPPKPVNITCASTDGINLNCFLTTNDTGQYTNWNVTYCIEDYIPTDDPLACTGDSPPLPGNTTNSSTCRPSPDRSPPGHGVMLFLCTTEMMERQVYRVNVEGVNNYGTTSYATSVYTGPSIVQYSAVTGLKVGPNVTSTSITFLWDAPVYISRADPVYSVVVTQSEMGYREVFTSTVNSLKVARLRPATTYLAEVRAKPRSSPYWSNPTYISKTTLETAPGVPPGLSPGMYTRWEDGVHLSVYWQAVPPALRNGNITHHQVCLYLPDNASPYCNSSIPGDQFHYLLDLPSGSGDCTVTVQAGTRVGMSEPSALRIPKIGQAPQRPLYVTVEQLDDSRYNVTWVIANHNVRLDHVFVTWCQGLHANQQITCRNDVHAAVIDGNASFYIVTHDLDPDLRKGAWFGVSTSVDDVSDGTTWNQCIFQTDGGAGSPPAMDVLSNASTTWLPLGFSYCDVSINKGRPLVYEVSLQSINTTSCSDINCTEGAVVPSPALFDTTDIILPTLTRRALYCVCLRVRGRIRVGPYSHPPKLVNLSVLEDAPGHKDIGAIVGVTTVLAIIAIVAIICAVYHRKRLHPLKKIPIDLGMFRDLEPCVTGQGGVEENRIGSENPTFQDIPADPTPVTSLTQHQDGIATMADNHSGDDILLELCSMQPEQTFAHGSPDNDSGHASDGCQVGGSTSQPCRPCVPEQAAGAETKDGVSESESHPSSGYDSTIHRSKTSRSSISDSVKSTQLLDRPGEEYIVLGAPSKPGETSQNLMPRNEQNRQSQHESIAVTENGGYVAYPDQVAREGNVVHNDTRKEDEESFAHLDYISPGDVDDPRENLEYVRCDVSVSSTDVVGPSTSSGYVQSVSSASAQETRADNLDYVQVNLM
ncbi:uncharacterized protein [Haliotis cracherodii]|uniref:uncharacterized protein n=1 Tax=Haliotis cracherodii TaxID=6455 RepID=UPI0039E8B70C